MRLYGTSDVPLCPDTLVAQVPQYRILAARLPRGAHWVTTGLSRTTRTAQAIFAAGYPPQSPSVEVRISRLPGIVINGLLSTSRWPMRHEL